MNWKNSYRVLPKLEETVDDIFAISDIKHNQLTEIYRKNNHINPTIQFTQEI